MEFVCDFCETRVSIADQSCSVCGGVFNDVKCPECDYRGKPTKFTHGCPRCHYNGTGVIKLNKSYSFVRYWTVIAYLGFATLFIMWLVLYRFMG